MHLCPMRRPCHFRNTRVKGGVHDDILTGGCRQIEDQEAEAALIDATLMESAARSSSHFRGQHPSTAGQERPEGYAGL